MYRSLVHFARVEAIRLHGTQLYGPHPYIVHLDAVVEVLRRFGVTDERILAGGYLHDVGEDVKGGRAALIALGFPILTLRIVRAVSDEEGPTRKERKAKTYPKIAGFREALLVKLADRIANVEEGAKKKMYAAEHAGFRAALYDPADGLDAMWTYLDGLLAA